MSEMVDSVCPFMTNHQITYIFWIVIYFVIFVIFFEVISDLL